MGACTGQSSLPGTMGWTCTSTRKRPTLSAACGRCEERDKFSPATRSELPRSSSRSRRRWTSKTSETVEASLWPPDVLVQVTENGTGLSSLAALSIPSTLHPPPGTRNKQNSLYPLRGGCTNLMIDDRMAVYQGQARLCVARAAVSRARSTTAISAASACSCCRGHRTIGGSWRM